MSEEVQTNPLQDLVQHALDQDYNKANEIFGDLMGTKIGDALDAAKIKLADQLYNGAEEDEEPNDDQLELDLEDETDETPESDDESTEEESDEELIDDEDDSEESEEEEE